MECAYRLLDVLADRKSKTALSGVVLFNGNKRPPNFKTLVGYVVQVRTSNIVQSVHVMKSVVSRKATFLCA